MGALLAFPLASLDAAPLKVSVFDVDATPPVGSMMAYDPVVRQGELPLRARGLLLQGEGQPVVLCAVDWLGISNEGHDAFRRTLASAAGTTMERVTVHTLHQHDAPDCDFLAEKILLSAQREADRYQGDFARVVLKRLEEAVKEASQQYQEATHAAWGTAQVKEVASNRRIQGPDGQVRVTRYTATKSAEVRAEPEGVIDPEVSLLSLWQGDRPLAVLTWYACHPQSYYRLGIPNPDFPGIARFIRRQAVPEALHVHFNGAGGNIGAGKYNDGSRTNRVQLALKLATGMRTAWEQSEKFPVTAKDLSWEYVPVSLPPAHHLDKEALQKAMRTLQPAPLFTGAADKLAWIDRCESGHQIQIGMLSIGKTRVVHMPGELFVEYQLAAKAMRPDLHVAMAAYGDYGPGYIGTRVAYGQGGYETSDRASDVAPEVEDVLMGAVRQLLGSAP